MLARPVVAVVAGAPAATAFARTARARFMLLAVTALVAAPTPAPAPDGPETAYLDAVDAWATAARLEQLLPDSGRAGESIRREARRKAPKATARQIRRLRFKRRADITARNVAAVAAQMPNVDPSTVAADIERNRKLAHERMRSLSGNWSAGNLADVAAFALLSAYSAYHERPRLSKRGSLAVLRAARNGLARSAKIRRVSASDKQTAAEMTEVRMVYGIAALLSARERGATHDMSIAESGIRIWIRDVYHLDLERVRLTSKGLAPR
jgi:hypothetical protein